MPEPINLQFDKISMSSSEASEANPPSLKGGAMKHTTPPQKDTIWARQFSKFKQDAMVSGTFYNMFTFSFVAFIGVFIILVIFRPPLVMTTPKATPQDPYPVPKISWPSILIWSLLMSAIVFAISFFTRPKPSPAYVLEK